MKKQNLYLAGLGIATVVLSLLPMGDKPAIAQLMENWSQINNLPKRMIEVR
jgi:hypothetical protein